MKALVVYHKVDLDGVCSAAVVKIKIEEEGGKVTLYGWTYGDPVEPVIEMAKDFDKIFLVDISFPDMGVLSELNNGGHEVIWIDHHLTAINNNPGIKFAGIREIGTAACELTHKFLYEEKEVPLLIKYLSAYDVWNKDRYEWDEVLAVQYTMRAYCGLSVSKVINYLNFHKDDTSTEESLFIKSLASKGNAIIKANSVRNKSECNMYAFEAYVCGYKAICMNTTEFNSTVFDSVWDESKYDVMLPFLIKSDGVVRCSLYTTRTEINCGELAAKFGGGGHKQAAGFQINFDSEEFKSFIQNKILNK